jgi:hypothetical protein
VAATDCQHSGRQPAASLSPCSHFLFLPLTKTPHPHPRNAQATIRAGTAAQLNDHWTSDNDGYLIYGLDDLLCFYFVSSMATDPHESYHRG